MDGSARRGLCASGHLPGPTGYGADCGDGRKPSTSPGAVGRDTDRYTKLMEMEGGVQSRSTT
jgi:hypothetical protein